VTNAYGSTNSATATLSVLPAGTVTSLADSGPGTLRAAIAASVAGDTLTFALGLTGTITLTNGELQITHNLTLMGAGATNLVVSGNGSNRVFNIFSGVTASISGLTISDGLVAGGVGQSVGGGGVQNNGSLVLLSCTISGNSAVGGFGYTYGGLGTGGGVGNAGTLALTNCTLSGNLAHGGYAGALNGNYNYGAVGGLGGGGGIYSAGSVSVSLADCTVSGNSAEGGHGDSYGGSGTGGGLQCVGAFSLRNTIVAGNTAYGGFGNVTYPAGGTTSGPDVDGTVSSQGFNLIGLSDGSSGWILNGTGLDLTGSTASPLDPLLGPLQNNGGPTPTMALLPCSPAVDAGSTDVSTDQRGQPRPYGNAPDIGAYELQAPSAFHLVVLANGPGTVAVVPSQICINPEDTVTLTATPSPGSGFFGWSGDAGGAQNPLVIPMTGNKSITASFAPLVGALPDIVSFNGTNGDDPGNLVQGSDGNFYGTTQYGGSAGYGNVFRITPSLVLTNLASFNYPNDVFPRAGLVQGSDGNFYGTTQYGGSAGYGNVFRITPSGALANLVSFNYMNGAYPWAGLVQGSDGNFYGTTKQGGSAGDGTVFRITPSGALTNLASFNNTNGAYPYAGLVQGSDGNFYGTTEQGGSAGDGTVFMITPSGVLTNLISFNNTNGAYPYAGLVQGSDGNFYGTTFYGGSAGDGTVFRITPAGTLTTLMAFNNTNGAHPSAALVQGSDGKFYGTTEDGGSGGGGVIFRLGLSPVITAQSPGQTNVVGGTARFLVAVAGGPPFSYQWRLNGVNLLDNGRLSGSSGNTLSISNLLTSDAGSYSVVVTNAYGSATSAVAVLKVVACPIITVGPATLPWGTPGAAYAQSLAAGGGAGPYLFFVTAGGLPAGLDLSATGLLSGPLGGPGTNAFTVTATDTNGCAGSQAYALVVSPPVIQVGSGSFGFGPSGFGFNLAGSAGSVLVVEGSSNLVNWIPITTNTLGAGPLYFTDPASSNLATRFYRARLQ